MPHHLAPGLGTACGGGGLGLQDLEASMVVLYQPSMMTKKEVLDTQFGFLSFFWFIWFELLSLTTAPYVRYPSWWSGCWKREP